MMAIDLKNVSFRRGIFFLVLGALSGCSVNPATGDRQFTALMSTGQEEHVGASEHEKVMAEFGNRFASSSIQTYVDRIGARLARNTERSDVAYKFFVLDTPIVNAFALPGGYVYVSRGLLAIANSEDELAAVLAHEIGHITARHSAERYSQGVLAGVGMAVLSAAVNDPGITRAAGLGSELAIKSYSRSQENQADELGIRYLSRAGYDPFAASRFLSALDSWTAYAADREGKKQSKSGYFDTHPQTDDRVTQTAQIARQYPTTKPLASAEYLRRIKGIIYGESGRTGYFRNQRFIHPDLGFTFELPEGFKGQNQANRVTGISKSTGAAVIFDGVKKRMGDGPLAYLKHWAGEKPFDSIEEINVNGHRAAIGRTKGAVNGQGADIRIVAVEWDDRFIYRFQIALPKAGGDLERRMINMVHSFRGLDPSDQAQSRPLSVEIVRTDIKDTVNTIVAQMNVKGTNEDPEKLFRVLNNLSTGDRIIPGRLYKIVR